MASTPRRSDDAVDEAAPTSAVTREPRAPIADWYRALIDAGIGVAWRSAADFSIIEASGWETLTGQRRDDYVGEGWLAAVHPDDRANNLEILERAKRFGEACEATYRVRQADGRYRWVRTRMVPLRDGEGRVHEWIGHLVDVHDKMPAAEALAKAEERLRLALEGSSQCMWDFDFRTKVIYWSDGAPRMLGLPEGSRITEESFLSAMHPEDRPAITRVLTEARKQAGHFHMEYRVGNGEGGERWLASSGRVLYDEEGKPLRTIGTIRDVTAQKMGERKLHHLAHFDHLTGLPNRMDFTQRLEKLLGDGVSVAVVLLDLDNLKKVNDTAGHHAGDLLLRAAAERLLQTVPPGAVVARWGGDEFAILIPRPDRVLPVGLIHELEVLCERPFGLPRREVVFTSSLGIALAPEHGASADELLANADLALYQAKAEGRALSRMFSRGMKDAAQGQMDLETDLRRAFAASEFEMHYQPQVCLADGTMQGAEALLRWRHPVHGLLSPASFMAVLKPSPIAAAVGDWTLATACAMAARLRNFGHPLRVSVNLFPRQLRAELPATVERLLKQHHLPPSLVEFEITENIVLKDNLLAMEVLQRLRALGVGIAFDDYGTGYASLSMLTEYPITRLKIDRAFVAGIEIREGDLAVVKAIVSLGKGFGMQVTAEGVETEAQKDALQALGCEEGQGYLFGRPVPAEVLISGLKASAPRLDRRIA